jgi:hypothetical protein
VEVEDEVELTHVAKVGIQALDKVVDDLQRQPGGWAVVGRGVQDSVQERAACESGSMPRHVRRAHSCGQHRLLRPRAFTPPLQKTHSSLSEGSTPHRK